jgi:prefoldin subunit 5
MTEEQELQMLKDQAHMLSQQLEGIERRIAELEKAEDAS